MLLRRYQIINHFSFLIFNLKTCIKKTFVVPDNLISEHNFPAQWNRVDTLQAPHILFCYITTGVCFLFFSFFFPCRLSLCLSLCSISCSFVFRYLKTHLTFIEFLVCTQIPLIISHKDTSILRVGRSAVVIHWRQAVEQKAGQVRIRHTSERSSRLGLLPSSSAGRLTVIA